MTTVTVHTRSICDATRSAEHPSAGSYAKSCASLDLSARWATWLAANFHSTEQIMAAFSVSKRTAEYWLKQATEPRARHLASAMASDPEAIPFLIGDTDALD